MICLNCGRSVDDDVRVCPFCGEDLGVGAPVAASEDDPMPITLERKVPRPEPAPRPEPEQEEEEPKLRAPKRAGNGGAWLSAILSLVSAVLCLVCLVMVSSMRSELHALREASTRGFESSNAAISAVDERLAVLDSTLATVQSDAYEQVASQSISITKDITPLAGPVDEGKYNQMFIVRAKGNLNVDTSFDWQRYNEATGGWVSIVFTGDATTNEQYGLRLENQLNQADREFTTILWANGITPEAAGSYRCVITDAGGITKTSSEAIVEIQPAE